MTSRTSCPSDPSATRPVHHEHLIFKPDVSLDTYFKRMMQHGVEHHFAFCYGDWGQDIKRLSELLGMPLVDLTQPGDGAGVTFTDGENR